MAREHRPWEPPLVELSIGVGGHPLAWEKNDADGSWWAWCPGQETSGRHVHTVAWVRAASLRPPEPPEAYQQSPRVRGHDGQLRDVG